MQQQIRLKTPTKECNPDHDNTPLRFYSSLAETLSGMIQESTLLGIRFPPRRIPQLQHRDQQPSEYKYVGVSSHWFPYLST